MSTATGSALLPRLPRLSLVLSLALAGYAVAPATASATCQESSESPAIDLFVVLDRSGSMAGSNWDGANAALTTFVNDSESAGAGMAMNFFPASGIAADKTCETEYYNPPQVPLGALPAAATTIINGMNSQVATGPNTPTYGALDGTYEYATAHQDNNPDRQVVVVLATDGQPNSCPDQQNSTAVIASLASAAHTYNGVKTYVIGIQGAAFPGLHSIAMAGNTGQAIDVTSDISAFLAAMETIRDSVLPDEDGDGIYDWADNCPALVNAGQEDVDGDCFGDVCDDDSDGDGTLNGSDAFPLDPSEDMDTDLDGLGNNADLDDDNDGLPDALEVAIFYDPLSSDGDGNGTGDFQQIVSLVQACVSEATPALTPPGVVLLVGLLIGFGVSRVHTSRGRRIH